MRWGVILLAGVLAGGPALAADEARVLRVRAEQLAALDRCEEALPRAARALELAPDDVRAALVEGRCALRLNRYERALEALEFARRLDPRIQGLHADLGVAYYHLGRMDDARREITAAEAEAPEDARVALYKGLLLLEEAENAEAAEVFARAARLDPELGPLAGYYEGRAWQNEDEREKAQAALEEVKARAPGTTWAEQADRALTRLDEPYMPHRWLRIQAGIDYDSNVVLRGDNVRLPQSISDEKDGRSHWSTDFGWEFLRNPTWSLGVIPAYSGDAHFQLSRYDLHYPNVSGWIDRRVDEVSFVRLRPFIGHAWRDGESYVTTGGGEIAYQRYFGELGTGRVFTEVTGNDYRFDLRGDPVSRQAGQCTVNCSAEQLEPLDKKVQRARDRDGVRVAAGYEHEVQVGLDRPWDSYLRGGVAGGHYDSKGEEYEHDFVELWLGARKELIGGITLDVMGSFAWEPYRNASTFVSVANLVDCPPEPDPCTLRSRSDRDEKVWNVGVLLERPFGPFMTATVRWRYQNNDSNTDTYDYDRHIVGGYITFYYGE